MRTAGTGAATRAVVRPVRIPDPQVAEATARYRPMPPDLAPSLFEQVVQVAREALMDLVPVVVVNRRADTAICTLSGAADADMPTIHTSPPPGLLGTTRRVGRIATERLHDTHGTGANAGRTVFGATRFVGAGDARAGAAAVLAALERQGSIGVGAYGPVSLLASGEAIRGRTTFAARDTALGITRVTDESHLPEVVAERIARGVPGAPSGAQLASSPRPAAVRTLRGWLTSDGLARRDGYIEAQVRGLAPAELAAVHVAEAPDGPHIAGIDPGPAPTPATVARIARLGARLGLAVSIDPDIVATSPALPGRSEGRPEGRPSPESGRVGAAR